MKEKSSSAVALEGDLTPGERHLSAHVQSFELGPLLRALEAIGYPLEKVLFRCDLHRTSKSQLCNALSFDRPYAQLTLNLGLLSADGLLPSYFFDALEEDTSQAKVYLRFFEFFNHHLIKELGALTLLEKNCRIFPCWSLQMRDYVSLSAVSSLSTFAHLIDLIFPDFDRIVKKNPKVVRLKQLAFSLGTSRLSEGSLLGGQATRTFANFCICLSTNKSSAYGGTPWPTEIRKRLEELLFPHIKEASIHLALSLVIYEKKGRLLLGKDSHLGFERIGDSSEPFELLIYYGLVGTTSRSQR